MAGKQSVFVGGRFSTNQGFEVEVVKYNNARDVQVVFNDAARTSIRVEAAQLKRGSLRNPNHPTYLGIGFIGVGPYKTKGPDNKFTKEYIVWNGMLNRCYSENVYIRNSCPTYDDCTVDEQWHNFQEFSEWYNFQVGSNKEGYQLDKDLLKRGNKVYGPENCILLPKDLNTLIVTRKGGRGEFLIGASWDKKKQKFIAQGNFGVGTRWMGQFDTELEAHLAYKKNKELYIKSMANVWKGKIDERAYLTLMKYEVNLDD